MQMLWSGEGSVAMESGFTKMRQGVDVKKNEARASVLSSTGFDLEEREAATDDAIDDDEAPPPARTSAARTSSKSASPSDSSRQRYSR